MTPEGGGLLRHRCRCHGRGSHHEGVLEDVDGAESILRLVLEQAPEQVVEIGKLLAPPQRRNVPGGSEGGEVEPSGPLEGLTKRW